MSIQKYAALFCALGSCASAIAAPNVVGNWVGQFHFKLTAPMPAARKQSFEKRAQVMTRSKILLTLRPNHTFSMKRSNEPAKAPPQNGMWTQKGDTISLSISSSPNAQPFTVSNNGKTLTFRPKTPKGIESELVLRR